MATVIIGGSNGQLVVDAESGQVDREESRYDGDDYRGIVRFDLVEWRATYGPECAGGDILDFGYWFIDKNDSLSYEPPVEAWRNEFRNEQQREEAERRKK